MFLTKYDIRSMPEELCNNDFIWNNEMILTEHIWINFFKISIKVSCPITATITQDMYKKRII